MTCTVRWRQKLDKKPGLLIVVKCSFHDTTKRRVWELIANAGFGTSRQETEGSLVFYYQQWGSWIKPVRGGQRASIHLIRSSFLWLPASAIQGEPESGGKAALPMQTAPVFACFYRHLKRTSSDLREARKRILNLVSSVVKFLWACALLSLHLTINHLPLIRTSLN